MRWAYKDSAHGGWDEWMAGWLDGWMAGKVVGFERIGRSKDVKQALAALQRMDIGLHARIVWRATPSRQHTPERCALLAGMELLGDVLRAIGSRPHAASGDVWPTTIRKIRHPAGMGA